MLKYCLLSSRLTVQPIFQKNVNSYLKFIVRPTGKVRVPWKTVCLDSESPFANYSGIETFEDGDEKSHITMKIPQYPREENVDRFDVVLSPPKSVESVLGDTTSCSVAIENDIGMQLSTL